MTRTHHAESLEDRSTPVEEVVEVNDLHKDYVSDGEPVHAVRGVTLSIRRGEFLVVMGASGSGKSTLLHMIGGLDRLSSGLVVIEGRNLARMSDRERTLFRRRRLGFVFQAYNLLPTLTALENVSLPASLDGRDARETRARAGQLLTTLDLPEQFHHHRPDALSGGEQQRVAIARALMNDPAVILADEPTGNLDSRHGQAVWKILADLTQRQNRTVIAVTHEAAGAALANRVVVIKDGRLVGDIHPHGADDVALVASRYRELVG